jgi:hypothetical protein
MPTLPIHNVHRRRLPAGIDTVGGLIETLGTEDDAIWAAHDWMPLWLDGPMATASSATSPSVWSGSGSTSRRS